MSYPRLNVVPFDAEITDAAVQLYEARHDKAWSLTDCFSFVVIEQQLTQALTTDRHFEQTGIRALILEEPPEN